MSEAERADWNAVFGPRNAAFTNARLTGADLHRAATHAATELESEGVVAGGIQAPPSGGLVVFLADHPVTGGYPVVAVLTEAARDRAAQLRPGEAVRLVT